MVRPQRAHQLVLGIRAPGRDVRHQRRRATHVEDAVGEVPVQAPVLTEGASRASDGGGSWRAARAEGGGLVQGANLSRGYIFQGFSAYFSVT
jgi:hypothetical protein